ncbi:energy-coupling factor transporter transmembrane component T family protein [Intrasporangium calvum]|uniref:Cobalt transport protein n=1 Tax=Intrasporangium calvum (strain ATCC 23552 / DSM 43043 / JCM 3097 / NBRC 12989 / NCIMB 10167 / NRRL B-3866 / 7 KIP) TaxID=710696 RepID=E6S736_INTC7|nr:energy-coupling factor transporter transmembrane protein EcfT [Intrasporangium calvum]ADU47931.1 cobalt transport protein [Intrasporangium calvum DSM 43043]AXG13031.1 energy-coupling factor transporter transmembrane protein EcfT [Intrasporangium calvum]
MSALAVYVPRDSLVHRLPAGTKLVCLVVAAAVTFALSRPWQVALALGVVALLYGVARVPWRTALDQVRPLGWFLGALAAFQVVVAGWERAVVVVGGMLGLVLLAALVSLTTRTTAIVDVVVRSLRPLRRVGVDPERVGLLVALGIRSVAVIIELAREVRQAQLARGAGSSPLAFIVPLVLRTLRHADRLADALVARGVDD